jgi:hypothetical protein
VQFNKPAIQQDVKFPKLNPFADTGAHMGCSSVRQSDMSHKCNEGTFLKKL